MDTITLSLNIFDGYYPVGEYNSGIGRYNPDKYGSTFSSLDDIRLCKWKNSGEGKFSVLLRGKDFILVDKGVMLTTLIGSLQNSFPGKPIEISMYYHFIEESNADGKLLTDMFAFERILENLTNEYNDEIIYKKSSSMLAIGISMSTRELDNIEKMKDIKSVRSDDISHSRSNPKRDYFEQMILGRIPDDDDSTSSIFDDDDDYKDPKPKVERSKVIKKSKNGKKMYDRHGVVVCNNKKAIKHDEKVIKLFLKDFIPGKGWKKDFRKDLVDRWMGTFIVTKKQLLILEKRYRKGRKHLKDPNIDKDTALEITRKIFNVNTDIWNDPRR